MKVLFFDFDGTLYIDGAISKDCQRELRRVRTAGHKIVLNTGRSYGFLPKSVRTGALFDGMICGCSYVRMGERVLENLTLSREVLRDAYIWGQERGVCVVFEGVDESYSVNGSYQDARKMFETEDDPMITKVTMWCDPAIVKDRDFPGLRIVHFQNYAEGILLGRDKSSGMKTLLDAYGLGFEDSIAFGDSENDADMLKKAGIGVCMASSPRYFDDFCAYRATARDGVPEALRRIFKEENA